MNRHRNSSAGRARRRAAARPSRAVILGGISLVLVLTAIGFHRAVASTLRGVSSDLWLADGHPGHRHKKTKAKHHKKSKAHHKHTKRKKGTTTKGGGSGGGGGGGGTTTTTVTTKPRTTTTKTTPTTKLKTTTTTSTAPTTPAPTTSADPSGVPIPTAVPAGWTETFADDFISPSMASDPQWRTYYGTPGGGTGGFWDPAHAVISGGELQLQGDVDPLAGQIGAPSGTYSTAGVASLWSQTYGMYLVRMRIDQGEGISFDSLLWPANKVWPPEIDFAEDNGVAPRSTVTATLQYGANDTKVTRTLNIDMTQWHTVGVVWSPGELDYTVDGQTWATVSSAAVPDIPMTIDLQTEAYNCQAQWQACPDGTTPASVNMDVDWVVGYAAS